jgi:AraC-like DNA-binding protein
VLVATSETRIGEAGARSTLILERAVRGMAVQRDALAFDTRYAAAAAGRAEPVGHVFLMREGRLVTAAGAWDAPVAVVLADDEMERPTAKSRTFRTLGPRVRVVQLRFARAHVRVPVGLAHGVLPLPPAVWDAADVVLAGAHTGDARVLARLLDALAAAGIVDGAVVGTLCADEPERFRRLWTALEPMYGTYGGTASLKQVAATMGMSMRQAGRDAKDLANTFGFSGGYRDTLLVLRLRAAVLLLAAPDATVAEVAGLVGYGSAIAMARAFRDASLPAPSVVQAALRGE